MVGSLLTAIVRADGDALVMHVGEKPYVVAPAGPVELSSRPLTLDAVTGMLGQLLPAEGRAALEELGAIEHGLPQGVPGSADRFTVVAARGGDDIWIEVRRHRRGPIVPPAVAEVVRSVTEPASVEPEPARLEPVESACIESAGEIPAVTVAAEAAPALSDIASPVREVAASAAETIEAAGASAPSSDAPPAVPVAPAAEAVAVVVPAPEAEMPDPAAWVAAAVAAGTGAAASVATVAGGAMPVAPPAAPVVDAASGLAAVATAPDASALASVFERFAGPAVRPAREETAAPIVDSVAARRPKAPEEKVDRQPAPLIEPIPAVVLPLARSALRSDASRVPASPRLAGIDRLLRLAVARGANTLFLMSQSRPAVRVNGEIATLEGEPALTAAEVESLLLDLAPERNREALENGVGIEWMSEVADVGRVRCQNFRDHRGPGGIFRLISARPASADQLGLSREMQALAAEPEGLILLAAPRAGGKTTLVSALVDLVNATRSEYVITIERHIQFTHEARGCLISQREARGEVDEVAAMTRGALRENPDVLVIDDLRSPEVMGIALDAVSAGHLVIASMPAHTATAALVRLIDQAPSERRQHARLTLAEGLRGIVAQALVHKSGGGRVAARELLLNTPSIASLIAEGRIDQLPMAIESGRKHGMVPLNDALAAFVQSGVVDAKEAYRKACDRQSFVAVLRREGIDTSFLERLA